MLQSKAGTCFKFLPFKHLRFFKSALTLQITVKWLKEGQLITSFSWATKQKKDFEWQLRIQ